MPEGPEVRVFADELAAALKGKELLFVSARTKRAREWLEKNPNRLVGKRVIDVVAYGKNLVGLIEGSMYFYSHQMMWGRWMVVEGETPPVVDRRERARLVVADRSAILMSAPVFELGEGDPFETVEYLHDLGPNALLYPGQIFDAKEFLKRFTSATNLKRTIGSALLDQTIVAGLGNYLRAEIMFEGRLDPWRTVDSLNENELAMISHLVPDVTARAFNSKATVTDEFRERMRADSTLVYVPGKDYGTRHHVFRRTNLPCLVCATPIRQMRQETGPAHTDIPQEDDEEEKTRIVYFCANCQNVKIPAKFKSVKKVNTAESIAVKTVSAKPIPAKPAATKSKVVKKVAAEPVVTKPAAGKARVKVTATKATSKKPAATKPLQAKTKKAKAQ